MGEPASSFLDAWLLFFFKYFVTLCLYFLFIYFLMWTVFKVFIEFVTLLLLFYVLIFWPWGRWDLSSPTRDRTCIPCSGRRSLNHWTGCLASGLWHVLWGDRGPWLIQEPGQVELWWRRRGGVWENMIKRKYWYIQVENRGSEEL